METEKFDYVICGGGASGILLANSLVSDSFFSNKKILLVEKDSKAVNDRTWCFWEKSESENRNSPLWFQISLPSESLTTWSPLSASFSLWVTTMNVCLTLSRSSMKRSNSESALPESKFPVGSSANTTLG